MSEAKSQQNSPEEAKKSSEKKSKGAPPAKKKAKPGKAEGLPSLVLTSAPHFSTEKNIEKIMYSVVIALIPACIAAVYFFGLAALKILILSVIGCLFFEAVLLKFFQPEIDIKKTVFDGSAFVTGILLALNLSAASPAWLVITGAFVAMFLGKHVWGGLGQNPFNPVLVSRVFLLISFPKYMSQWISARGDVVADAASYATPLTVLQIQGVEQAQSLSKLQLFLGACGGCIGETSVLALLIGGIFLLAMGIIRWHIPVSYILTVLIFTAILRLVNPSTYADPVFHLLTGGLFIGAIFMATDMVTSPITGRGMLIFGAGCGLLTVVIRVFGNYPEGVSFAILIMNGFTPLIDRYIKGPRYGISRKLISSESGA